MDINPLFLTFECQLLGFVTISGTVGQFVGLFRFNFALN